MVLENGNQCKRWIGKTKPPWVGGFAIYKCPIFEGSAEVAQTEVGLEEFEVLLTLVAVAFAQRRPFSFS